MPTLLSIHGKQGKSVHSCITLFVKHQPPNTLVFFSKRETSILVETVTKMGLSFCFRLPITAKIETKSWTFETHKVSRSPPYHEQCIYIYIYIYMYMYMFLETTKFVCVVIMSSKKTYLNPSSTSKRGTCPLSFDRIPTTKSLVYPNPNG